MSSRLLLNFLVKVKNQINHINNNMKLKSKLVVGFSFFIFFPLLLLGVTSYYISYKNMHDAEEKSFSQNMTQLNNTIDYFYEIYVNKSQVIFNNIDLQQVLMKNNNDIVDQLETQKRLDNIISQMINDIRYPYMRSSYYFGGTLKLKVYTINETIYFDNDSVFPFNSIKDEDWCRKLFSDKKLVSWQSNVKEADGKQYIVMNRRLLDFDTAKDIGVIRLFIPRERLINIIHNNTNSNPVSILYMDESNNDIYSEGNMAEDPAFVLDIKAIKLNQGINYKKIRNKEYLVGNYNSNITDWRLVCITPINAITAKIGYISIMTMITIIVSMIMCVLIASFISLKVTKRIDILVKKTNRIKGDNLTIDTIIAGNDEIGQLDQNFNGMIERIKSLIENDYKSKLIVNKTRLELLQGQINPHMLYNSLAVIGQIEKKGGEENVLKLVNNLIGFYRGVLNTGKLVCSLSAEIEITRKYISIMNFVYNSDIDAVYEIDDHILNYYSIKLFLQPIVENAVVHGIKPKGTGIILVTGRKIGDVIEFVVSDDGVGMDKSMVDGLNSVLDRKWNGKGYGIINVIKRVNLFFGDKFGVHIDSTPGIGTTVKVVIPAFSEKEIVSDLESKYLLED